MIIKLWLTITVYTFVYSTWIEIRMDRKTGLIRLYKKNIKELILSRLLLLLICCVPVLREIYVLGIIETEKERSQ